MRKETIMCLGLGLAMTSLASEKIPVVAATASNAYKKYAAEKAYDGKVSDQSRWIGKTDANGQVWLELKFGEKREVSGVHIYSGHGRKDAIEDFHFEFKDDSGQWVKIPSAVILGNKSTALSLPFDTTVDVVTDTLRLVVSKSKGNVARIKELVVWPATGKAMPGIKGESGSHKTEAEANVDIPLIYLNQSGFNLGKTKRFTAPKTEDGIPFEVINKRTGSVEFSGSVSNHTGDFTEFNPDSNDEYVVKAGEHESFPFRIGHWWLERITYQNAVTFMDQSRHYFGNHKKECRASYGWRDDHYFGWELTTLVPQYLSNPSAYDRMPKNIRYEQRDEFNGALEPFKENAPDIVKLIHFGADVIVTQELKHAFLKEQLAFFVYAWPAIKQWMPEQNYAVVRDFLFTVWAKEGVDHKFRYAGQFKTHNLLKVQTNYGGSKGQRPPGHSVLPNLLMYEVAKREKRDDAELYFEAAYNQVEWMVKSLEWSDPLTTKGQRLSEHVTMTGLALMLKQYPDRAPQGLEQKIEEWKKIVIGRSENMWDFRKLSDTQWVPTGPKRTMWNEPGNLIGFPACALAALSVTPDSPQNARLREISKAQMDNAFGRNPTGRHFSYDAPREIEGCELGWYKFHRGGIGQLADVVFVFDAAPKNEHYPYNPQVGNVGWYEGWVNFNTCFNVSLAYMAYDDTELKIDKDTGTIRLKAPLNFNYDKVENATVDMVRNGRVEHVKLAEESENSAWLSITGVNFAGVTEVSYGYGYLKHSSKVN